MSGYPTFMSIPQVDGLSTDPRDLGRHSPYVAFAVLIAAVGTQDEYKPDSGYVHV